jgi:hypothetical protein
VLGVAVVRLGGQLGLGLGDRLVVRGFVRLHRRRRLRGHPRLGGARRFDLRHGVFAVVIGAVVRPRGRVRDPAALLAQLVADRVLGCGRALLRH